MYLRCDFSVVYTMQIKVYSYIHLIPPLVQFEMPLKAFYVQCMLHTNVSKLRIFFFSYTEINIAELFIIIWNEIVCKMVIFNMVLFFLENLTVEVAAIKPVFYLSCEYATTLRTYNVKTVQMGKNDTVFFCNVWERQREREHSTWINSNLNFHSIVL